MNREASMESCSSTTNNEGCMDDMALPALILSLKDSRVSSKCAIEEYIASTDTSYCSKLFSDACWADIANMDKVIASQCYSLVLNKSIFLLIRSVAAVCFNMYGFHLCPPLIIIVVVLLICPM